MILYKYLPPARIDVLSKGRIRFTQPAAFNDPFESRPCFPSIKRGSQHHKEILTRIEQFPDRKWYFVDPLTFREISKRGFIRRMETDPSVVEYLAFSPIASIQCIVEDLYENPSRTLGVLSLSERLDSLPMWAHYTDNHTGLVVGFDISHSWFQRSLPDPFHQPQKVVYSNDRPPVSNLAVFAAQHLLTKSPQWEYEQEWRMITFLNEADATIQAEPWPIHLFEFPPESLVSLYIGYRMPPQVKQALSKALDSGKRYRQLETYFAYVSREDVKFGFMEVAF